MTPPVARCSPAKTSTPSWRVSPRSGRPSTPRWPTSSSTSTASHPTTSSTVSWRPCRDHCPCCSGDRSYDVLVGRGARHRLLEVLPVGAARAAVVTQADIGVQVDAGVEQRTFLMGDGERAKDLETVEDLCRQFSRWGLTRGDVVVAVG